MQRTLSVSGVLLFGVAVMSSVSAQSVTAPDVASVLPVRQHVVDDVFHESIDVRLGSGPNAVIRLHRIVRERAPWWPRATRGAVMLLHGDFASFSTNFAPGMADPDSTSSGLAVWLAQQHFDVWGVDRRWALTPQAGDLSDYAQLSFEQEVDDVGVALSLATALRGRNPSQAGFHLIGFSRGGYLAYAAAAADARRPGRHLVRSLVPLDMWAELAPDDEIARKSVCDAAAVEREALADGVVDSENSYFITAGQLALTAPQDPSPLSTTGQTNRELFLQTAAQTYQFYQPSQYYHLAAGNIVAGVATGLRESPEPTIAGWFAHATPHQSMRESADSDGMWCDDGAGPQAPTLSAIRVPLLLIAAAGGYGEHTFYSTTRVSSRDVRVLLIQRAGLESAEQDFGHGDLLFATDAPKLVWQPLADWLNEH